MVYLKFLSATCAIGAVLAAVAVALGTKEGTRSSPSSGVEREERLRLLL